MNRLLLLALAGVLALGLTACKDKEGSTEPASAAAVAKQTSNPTGAVEALMARLRDNQLLEAIQIAVPPENFDQLRAQWEQRSAELASDPEENADFAATMGMLTAGDAEESLYALLEPKLVEFEAELAPQWPMLIGMGQGFAIQAVQANEDLNAEQKEQASELLGAMAAWLQSAPLTDRELARKGVATAVRTARALDVDSFEQVRGLSFEQMLGKAGLVFGGIKEVLALYGLDLDQALATTRAEVVSSDAGAATVAVRYKLLGKEFRGENEMVEIDGRWYGKDTVEQLVGSLTGIGSPD